MTNEDLAKLCDEAADDLCITNNNSGWRKWRARSAFFSAMEPSKLVPLEPDLAMARAGEEPMFCTYTGTCTGDPLKIIKAGIAAAPEVTLP